jgi:hypothetical protein
MAATGATDHNRIAVPHERYGLRNRNDPHHLVLQIDISPGRFCAASWLLDDNESIRFTE